MDTIAMKYFMEIASGQTFWDVAEKHNISQSAVSKSILKLENELGVKLFDRSKRLVRLTPAGAIFLDTLKLLEPEFQKVLDRIRDSSERKISLCIVPHLDFLDLRLRIQNSNFSELFPDVSLILERQLDPIQPILDLNEDKIDFVICHQFNTTTSFCDSIPLLQQDALCAVLPTNHPLSGRKSIDFSELYEEPILIRSLVIKEALKECCEFIGKPVPPNSFIFHCPSSELRREQLISRVAFGQGITLYFESDLYPFKLDNVYVCPLTGCPDFPVVLSKKKGKELTDYQEAFQKHLCETIFQK